MINTNQELKKIFLTLEATILLVPIFAMVLWASLLTIIVGIPANIAQIMSKNEFDSLLLLSTVGTLFALYAMSFFFKFVKNTLNGETVARDHSYFKGITAFFISSVCAIILFKGLSVVVIVPPLIILGHFSYLQNKCDKYSHNKHASTADA